MALDYPLSEDRPNTYFCVSILVAKCRVEEERPPPIKMTSARDVPVVRTVGRHVTGGPPCSPFPIAAIRGPDKSTDDANSDRCQRRAVAFMLRRYTRQTITDTVAGAGNNGRDPCAGFQQRFESSCSQPMHFCRTRNRPAHCANATHTKLPDDSPKIGS